MTNNKSLKVYCDGGARGNPGPAGIGVVVDDGAKKRRFKKQIGIKTNNQAEYEAVIFALKKIKKQAFGQKIIFYLDSLLVVNQLKGKFKIKNQKLGRLLIKVNNFIVSNDLKVEFCHISRNQNKEADFLANKAMDNYQNEIS